MANYYTYGKIPSAEETVYGPLSQGYAEGGVAAPKIPPGLEAAFLRMRGQSPEQLAAKAEATVQTKPQREVLSDLLQTGQFDQAFKYAKDQGVQNLLIDPTELKTLRGPFSNDEMKSFFSAMPKDLMGEHKEREVKFTPDKALDQSLQVASIPREGIAQGPLGDIIGYPDVQRAFEPQQLVKEPNAFDKLIKAAVYGGLAFAGATALAGSSALGKAIVQLPETIGLKVGEALGANTLSSLQAKMIGNAVISGGVTGAKGGDFEDILKSAALAAGFTYVSDKAIKTIAEGLQKTGITDSVKNIPGGDVTAVDPSVATDVASKVSQGLDQFTVTFSPASTAAQTATTVGALGAAQATTPTAEKQSAPEDEIAAEYTQTYEKPVYDFGAGLETGLYTGQRGLSFDEVPTVDGQQEVKVETPADKPVETPPVVVTSPIDTPFVEAPTVDNKQEIKVETPADKPVETPPVITSPVDTPFEEAPTVDNKQEVKVETPADKPVETPPVVVTSPVDTPFVEAPTVDDKQEIKVETPADKPVETPPVVVTPPPAKTEPPPDEKKPEEKKEEEDPMKALLEKYGTLENFLKLLGALGSAGSKTPTAPVVTPTAPSMGGALPKYTYTRQQLSPDIDYYTYGTRPEAKFFEQSLQLEKPTQPELPPAKTPEEDKPMAMGGLTGYAEGGSSESRYVDGPGSGREDKIPALLSDGEYVMDAETLALLGDGSTKEGARRMDEFRAKIRQHKGRALSRGQISPDAKSPHEYMGGGLA